MANKHKKILKIISQKINLKKQTLHWMRYAYRKSREMGLKRLSSNLKIGP
jgi:hypothetical protein